MVPQSSEGCACCLRHVLLSTNHSRVVGPSVCVCVLWVTLCVFVGHVCVFGFGGLFWRETAFACLIFVE